MPPRNSNTKTFRKYRRPGVVPVTTQEYIQIEKLIDDLNHPINNKYYTRYEKFREEAELKGRNFVQEYDKIEKKEGDRRYADKQWYKDKERGLG